MSSKDYQVFNASTYTSLVWFGKPKSENLNYLELDRDLKDNVDLSHWLGNIINSSFTNIAIDTLGSDAWHLMGNNELSIFQKMEEQPSVLGDVFQGVFQGIVTGDNDVFILKNCIPSGSDYVSCFSDSLQDDVLLESNLLKPLLTGNTINRYKSTYDKSRILYPYYSANGKTKILDEATLKNQFPKAYDYLRKQKERLSKRGSSSMKYPSWYSLWNYRTIEKLSSKKILTPDVCHMSQMWLDQEGYYFHIDTSYALIIKEQFSENELPIYLVLNSLLTWFYLINTGTVLRGGFFRFKTSYLQKFPLSKHYPPSFMKLALIRQYVKDQMCNSFDRVIDALVFQLYFPDHMEEKQIDVMQFVDKDLREVMQGQDFEQLADSEKEKIIEQLHARWSRPDSEVRNRIKLFAVRSPEILKPILESK